MKHLKILLALSMFVPGILKSSAQDTLTLINGNQLIVNVVEIHGALIRFSLPEDSLTVIQLPLERVRKVVYTSGKQLQMDDSTKIWLRDSLPETDIEIAHKARKDASKYYRGYRPAGTGTFFVTLFGSPVLGLIPAIATSSTPPQPRNSAIPLQEFALNPVYLDNYTREAHKIKKNRVWMNYAIAGITSVVLGILVYESISNIGVGY